MLEERVNGKVYYLNERLVLTEAMHDVKEMYLFASEVKSEKDDNNHRSYEFILHDWFNRCPKFVNKWLRLAVVDKDDYINVKNKELYDQFIAVGQALLKAYDLRYRYLDIINFLSLFKDQKDWERYSDKTFNWLFAKYGLFDIKAVKQLDVSGLNDVKINTENIDKVIAFYKKLDTIDLGS